MEIKINREIMQYSETVFMGLSLRQTLCSALAVLAAVTIYLLCKGTEIESAASYLCMLGALPFAFIGFFRYHAMSAERFLWEFIRSEFIERRVYISSPRNIYMDLLSYEGM